MQLMNEKTQRKILSGIKSGEARRKKGLMLKEHINEQCSSNVRTTFKQCSNNAEQYKY